MKDVFAPYRSIGTIVDSTSATAVYTVNKNFVNVQTIRIANVSGSAVDATVAWYDASEAETFTLLFEKSIAANDVEQIEIQGFQIADNDQIRVTASTADALHVVVTVVEVPGRSG